MNESFVTCKSIASYPHILSRGKHYQVFGEKGDCYRIKGNHGRKAWVHKHNFIEGIITLPILVHWQFDDALDEFDFIEVTITFSDETKRWCVLTTPEKLLHHFQTVNMNPPGFALSNLIINKTLSVEDVEATLRHLDGQDELIAATLV